MSKSKARVAADAAAKGLNIEIVEITVPTTTAQQAADAMNVHVDQIAKSIIFRGENSGAAILFVTSGGSRVDVDLAASFAGEPLGRADAAFIRAVTGFAIGGVSPIGHLTPPRAFFDRRLCDFAEIWAAAGTPHHMFSVTPDALIAASNAMLADFTA